MERFSGHRPCSTRSMSFSGTSVSQFGTVHCMWRGGGVGKERLSLRVPARRVTTRKNPEGSRGSCAWILRPSSSQTHSARPHLTKLLLGGLPQSSRGSQGRIGGHTVRNGTTVGHKIQRKTRGERKAGQPPAPVLNHPAPLQPRRPGSGCPCLAPVCPADYRSHDARTMRRGPELQWVPRTEWWTANQTAVGQQLSCTAAIRPQRKRRLLPGAPAGRGAGAWT